MHFKKCLLFAYCLQKWTAKRAPILSRYTSSFSCARDFSTARGGEEGRSFFFFFLFPSCASHAVPIVEGFPPRAVSRECQSIAFFQPHSAPKCYFYPPHTAIWWLDQVQRHWFSTTTRVPPYVFKWLCGLLYSKRCWMARVTACSPTPQRLACPDRRVIAAANWSTVLLWKPRKSGVVARHANCALLRDHRPCNSRHYYFCCLRMAVWMGRPLFSFLF